jgi:hypothetical protein
VIATKNRIKVGVTKEIVLGNIIKCKEGDRTMATAEVRDTTVLVMIIVEGIGSINKKEQKIEERPAMPTGRKGHASGGINIDMCTRDSLRQIVQIPQRIHKETPQRPTGQRVKGVGQYLEGIAIIHNHNKTNKLNRANQHRISNQIKTQMGSGSSLYTRLLSRSRRCTPGRVDRWKDSVHEINKNSRREKRSEKENGEGRRKVYKENETENNTRQQPTVGRDDKTVRKEKEEWKNRNRRIRRDRRRGRHSMHNRQRVCVASGPRKENQG